MIGQALQNVAGPNDHAQARVILAEAWKQIHGRLPSKNELDSIQTIAHFETLYGRGGQFSQFAAQGKYNWGALQRRRNADGSCPSGTEPGFDATNPRCFYVYSSDLDAAKAYLNVLTKQFPIRAAAILSALATGNLTQVATAMKTSPPYYEAPVDVYARGLVSRAQQIFSSFTPTDEIPRGTTGAALLLAIAVGGTFYLLSQSRRRR